jgi:hypothetical protein
MKRFIIIALSLICASCARQHIAGPRELAKSDKLYEHLVDTLDNVLVPNFENEATFDYEKPKADSLVSDFMLRTHNIYERSYNEWNKCYIFDYRYYREENEQMCSKWDKFMHRIFEYQMGVWKLYTVHYFDCDETYRLFRYCVDSEMLMSGIMSGRAMQSVEKIKQDFNLPY